MQNKCPKGLNKPPCKSCPLGKESVNQVRRDQEPGCEWFVADSSSYYCFFKYMESYGNKPISPAKTARMCMEEDSFVSKTINTFKKLAKNSI